MSGRAGILGVLVHGRLDLSGSVDTASELDRAWRDGELVVLEDSGHRTSDSKRKALLDALYRFAARNAP